VIKAVFSASLLQSSVSHDPSEITLMRWFAAQEKYYYQYWCFFCGNHLFFPQDYLMNRKNSI